MNALLKEKDQMGILDFGLYFLLFENNKKLAKKLIIGFHKYILYSKIIFYYLTQSISFLKKIQKIFKKISFFL